MFQQTVSPASPDVHVIQQEAEKGKIVRVGAYCRVSTDMDVQKSSLDTQMHAYERIIAEHPGWELAGIYADKGISGTAVNKRTEFLRMIDDAEAGKIDYILVKSISRFSRNTVDLLRYVRELKEIGVNVYFEKEHIDTGNSNSEFMLSIFAAAAQEEIISLSENMKSGRRMRYAQGIDQWTHIYGYDKGWKIVPSEAAVIRRIFSDYLDGKSLPAICKELNAEGIPVASGEGRWEAHTVASILRNEKYAGHALLQKSYIKDPIKHLKVSNRDAVVKQYFTRNHHKPIVPEAEWEAAKMVLTMKARNRGMTQYPFYGILRCPFCGAAMVRFHYIKNDYFWTCGGNQKGTTRKERSHCPPFVLYEAALQKSLQDAGYPLEYWPLLQQLSSITFAPGDWDHLLLQSVNGGDTVTIPITYDLPTNSPLPTVTEGPYEWVMVSGKKTKKATFINGIPIHPSRSVLMVKRIRGLQDTVRSLTIFPPEPYESDVPKVDLCKTAPSENTKE